MSPRGTAGGGADRAHRQTVLQIDKAQAARGKFELLKVHLDHPQLNLERDVEGRWNVLSLLTAKPNQAGAVPFVTLHDGVIRFQDKKLDFPVLHLTSVEAKLVPQPTGILTGEGNGHSDFLGVLAFRFAHNPQTNVTELTVSLPAVEYQPKLEAFIVKLIPNWQEQRIRVQGRLGVETKITWLPHQDIPTIESFVRLDGGEFRHPKLPIPLQNIKAQLDYTPDKLTLRSLSATADNGTITGKGRVNLAPTFAVLPTIRRGCTSITRTSPCILAFITDCRRCCGNSARSSRHKDSSTASLDVSWKDQKVGLGYTLQPHQGRFEADVFLTRPRQSPDSSVMTNRAKSPVMHVDIQGLFGRRPFTLKGRLFGWGLRPENNAKPGIDLQVDAQDVPIDAALLHAPGTLSRDVPRRPAISCAGQFDPRGADSS